MRAGWWWIDRWRKSTAYTDMTAEEQGVYRNLLDELWLREGAIPTDERILAKIGGDYEAWPRVRETVLARFYKTDEGYRNVTHDEVMEGTFKFKRAQREKGRKRAAQAKRGPGGTFQPNQPNQPDTSRDTSQRLDQPNQPVTSLPSPSPSPSKEQAKNSGSPTDSVADKPRPNNRAADVRAVFDHFRDGHNHPRARLSEKRKRLIRARLNDGYSVDDLQLAIDGLHLSRWHTDNGNLTLEYGLRNSDKIEGLQAVAENPHHPDRVGRMDLCEKSRRTIDAAERFARRHANG